MKKKILALLLVAACVLMAACGTKETNKDTSVSSGGSSVEDTNSTTPNIENDDTDFKNPTPVKFGEDFWIDLNSDGILDEIESSIVSGGSFGTEISLTINGWAMGGDLMFAHDDNDDVNFDYVQSCFYIVDLDTSDETFQIMIGDYGPSDDPTTYFYNFDGRSLEYIGYVSDLYKDGNIVLYGDGTLSADMPLEMVESVKTTAMYQVVGSDLVPVLKEWYQPDYSNHPQEYLKHAVLQDITVYTEKSTDSESVVLRAGEDVVTFPATDNVAWVQVQTQDGQIYYMYMSERLVIDSAGTELYVWEVFDKLFLVG